MFQDWTLVHLADESGASSSSSKKQDTKAKLMSKGPKSETDANRPHTQTLNAVIMTPAGWLNSIMTSHAICVCLCVCVGGWRILLVSERSLVVDAVASRHCLLFFPPDALDSSTIFSPVTRQAPWKEKKSGVGFHTHTHTHTRIFFPLCVADSGNQQTQTPTTTTTDLLLFYFFKKI